MGLRGRALGVGAGPRRVVRYVRRVLFLLFGSSGAGKTFALNELRGRVADLAVHDFDEIGIPSGADTPWRHRANERWLRRALEYQSQGTDLLLAGQTPLGELLSAPSASRLDAVSACLIDCDDDTRIARLEARGPEWFARTAAHLEDYLNWAAWMRGHAADPAWRTDVIRHDATQTEMRWARLDGWHADDPRWRVRVIDTSDLPVDEVGMRLLEWIGDERALLRLGKHPLPGAALDDQSDA
jgi:hypothetical protein